MIERILSLIEQESTTSYVNNSLRETHQKLMELIKELVRLSLLRASFSNANTTEANSVKAIEFSPFRWY